LIFDLLVLRFLQHLVTLLLLLLHFLLKLLLLSTFNLHLFLSSIEEFFIEILSVFLIFLAKFLSKFDLLIKYISDLCLSLRVHGLLLFDLLFVELLAELLDLTPLIVTDVRRQVFNFDSPYSVWKFANLLAAKLGRSDALAWHSLCICHQTIQISDNLPVLFCCQWVIFL